MMVNPLMNDHKCMERLMLFAELAQQLSFTQAAKTLGISKGYLSEQIKRLEQELNTALLIRTTRSVRLTQQGEKVLNQSLVIKAHMHQLTRSITEHPQTLSGTLRITAPKMFAETWLFDLCEQFHQQHPDIDFDIHCSYSRMNLNQQDIDLAFRATNQPPQDMIAVPLLHYQHVLVASPGYLKQHGTPEHIQELHQHQCLTTRHQQVWPLRSQDIAVTGWLTTNENHMLKQRALNGDGIIRIASYYVRQALDSGELQAVLPDETPPQSNQVFMFYPQLIYPSPNINAFVTFIKQAFQD